MHARHDETARCSGDDPRDRSDHRVADRGNGWRYFSCSRRRGSSPPGSAWVPAQNSTGGKTRLGRITKTGNREYGGCWWLGATSVVVQRADGWDSAVGTWLRNILERRPVQTGDRGAREQDGTHRLGGDDAQGGLPSKGWCHSRSASCSVTPPHRMGRRRAQARLIRQETLNSVRGRLWSIQQFSGNTVSSQVCLRARQTGWCLTRKRTPMMASGERRATGRT